MTVKTRKPPIILDHSDEEEKRIQKAIADDPDTWEYTGKKDNRPTPPVRMARKYGLPDDAFLDENGCLRERPDLAHLWENKSVPVTLNLDRDVVDALKSPDPEGWEDRANALLKKAVGL